MAAVLVWHGHWSEGAVLPDKTGHKKAGLLGIYPDVDPKAAAAAFPMGGPVPVELSQTRIFTLCAERQKHYSKSFEQFQYLSKKEEVK